LALSAIQAFGAAPRQLPYAPSPTVPWLETVSITRLQIRDWRRPVDARHPVRAVLHDTNADAREHNEILHVFREVQMDLPFFGQIFRVVH
jgi:hypothetical protein